MKISHLEVFVIGDGPEIDPDKGGIEPLACIRMHTDHEDQDLLWMTSSGVAT